MKMKLTDAIEGNTKLRETLVVIRQELGIDIRVPDCYKQDGNRIDDSMYYYIGNLIKDIHGGNCIISINIYLNEIVFR